MTANNDIRQLLQQYLQHNISSSEKEQLFSRLEQDEYSEEELLTYLDQLLLNTSADEGYDRTRWQPAIRNILDQQQPAKKSVLRRLPVWTRVAAAILLIAAAWLVITLPKPQPQQAQVKADKPAPTSNHATITLADGSMIYLDSVANGQLATLGNTSVIKLAGGQVAYKTGAAVAGPEQYNTLVNPRGSKVIQLMLADGSQVWLNAGTTFRYPVSFNGPERKVMVNGEAYFEITPDPAKPFSVEKDGLRVDVLGTSFNLNAYDDEEVARTTLITGKIRVKTNSVGQQPAVILAPGQQAWVKNSITVREGTDLEQVLAWKNGYFQVENAGIGEVMRQLARWYNISIKYEGAVTNRRFSGKIPRNLPLSSALRILRLTEIEAHINGNELVISSK